MVDIENEKITSTVPTTVGGTFKKIANEGDIITCGEPIAEIVEE